MNRKGVGVVLILMSAAACDSNEQKAGTAATAGDRLLVSGASVEADGSQSITAVAGESSQEVSNSTAIAATSSIPVISTSNNSGGDGDTVSPGTSSTVTTHVDTYSVSDSSHGSSSHTAEPQTDHAETQSVESDDESESESAGSQDSNLESSSSQSSDSSVSEDAVYTDGGEGASASASGTASLNLNEVTDSEMVVVADSEHGYCAEVGEVVELNVSGALLNTQLDQSIMDLTALATLDLREHTNLQVVSHGDNGLSVTVTSSDILDLVFQYENVFDVIYVSAVDPQVTKPLIIRKQFDTGSCSFALYTENGCAVVASDIGLTTAEIEGITIAAEGCALSNPEVVPVIDLQ